MSYYGQGDFYGRGGYYRGDPGFFSFLGKVAKSAVGLIPGVGPTLSSLIPAAKATSTAVKVAEELPAAGKAMQVIKGATGIIKKHPILSGAAAAGVGGVVSGVAGTMAARAMKGHLFGGSERKRRRMNPCNPRALRRAIRRAHAFERLAKRVIGFSSPRKPKGRMYFRAKRKR